VFVESGPVDAITSGPKAFFSYVTCDSKPFQ